MNKLILDSSAWIEYLGGTSRGMKIREFVFNSSIFTTAIIAAEVFTKYLKDKKNINDALNSLNVLAQLIQLDLHEAHEAAQIYIVQRKNKEKFGLADAHVVAAARKVNAKIITCDNDFSGIPEAIVIS